MAKRTRWKIATAALAVVVIGIVYCVFFAEEKDEAVQYHTEEAAREPADDSYGNEPIADFGKASADSKGSNSGTGQNSGTGLNSTSGQSSSLTSETEQVNNLHLIYVHICGAVQKPAVYSLPEGSRVYDAIAKAGGMTETAADDYVNQARFLSDGERVYIPEKEELNTLSASQYAAGQPLNSVGGNQGGNGIQTGSQEKIPVNINTAGISELTTLPGIGESRAESIIAYREKHGYFARIEDIMKISGIKGAAYEKIKDRICTGNE